MNTRAIFVGISSLTLLGLFYLFSTKNNASLYPLKTATQTKESKEQINKNFDQEESSISKSELDHEDHVHEDHDHDHNHEYEKSLAQTALANERFFTEKEIENMSAEEFSEVVKDIERKLPKLQDIRQLPEQALHHTPVALISAGKDLGLIKEILETHKSYEPEALNFYERCAQNDESPTPLRALCLTNIIEINNKNSISTDTSVYPKDIVELSELVIGI